MRPEWANPLPGRGFAHSGLMIPQPNIQYYVLPLCGEFLQTFAERFQFPDDQGRVALPRRQILAQMIQENQMHMERMAQKNQLFDSSQR